MKIAIAVSKASLESNVDSRFGRCPFYLIVNTEVDGFKVIKNTAGQEFRGAGISAAQMIADKKVDAVIAGNFGPKAINVLSNSGIKTFMADSNISVKQAVEDYKDGNLKQV